MTSPTQKGNNVRMAYVNDLNSRGIQLRRSGRSKVIFETKSGKTIGMPFANEYPSRKPGRWFLGLPDQNFDFVILLCETDSGALLDFVFPTDFVSDIWGLLSRQKSHGPVKFEVFRCRTDDELKVKDGVAKNIRRFLGGVEILS